MVKTARTGDCIDTYNNNIQTIPHSQIQDSQEITITH